jgi:hypothetical protein
MLLLIHMCIVSAFRKGKYTSDAIKEMKVYVRKHMVDYIYFNKGFSEYSVLAAGSVIKVILHLTGSL